MRWALSLGAVLVFLAGAQLYVLADYTDRFFAWTIKPSLSAAFLGAFYWSACVLAFLSARQRTWAHARVGVVGVLLFVTLTLGVTLLHVDRFHLFHRNPVPFLAAWFWLLVYLIEPPVLLALLVLQLGASGSDPPRGSVLPNWFRGVTGAHATLAIVLGATLLVSPAGAALFWPWPLSPLVARAAGAWLMATGVILTQGIWEDDWERTRAGAVSYAVLGAFQLLAIARYPDDIDWSRPRGWIYLLIILSVLLVGIIGSFSAWQADRVVLAAGVRNRKPDAPGRDSGPSVRGDR